MAQFGARLFKFAPITDHGNADKMPTYGPSVVVGKLSKANQSINTASGTIDGDDAEVLSIEEFVSAGLDCSFTEVTPETESVIYGSKIDDSGDLKDSTGDSIPYGGITFCRFMMGDDGKKYYQCVFYPRAKAVPSGDDASTKGKNITLNPHNIKFNATECAMGIWRIRAKKDTFEEAEAWCDAKLGTASASD